MEGAASEEWILAIHSAHTAIRAAPRMEGGSTRSFHRWIDSLPSRQRGWWILECDVAPEMGFLEASHG
jgi:hypothetical protein